MRYLAPFVRRTLVNVIIKLGLHYFKFSML
nr:MAG TPA: hypothetical protein [Caudoviricetes sp.]